MRRCGLGGYKGGGHELGSPEEAAAIIVSTVANGSISATIDEKVRPRGITVGGGEGMEGCMGDTEGRDAWQGALGDTEGGEAWQDALGGYRQGDSEGGG
jgi:hypothetical protein